MMWSRSRWVGVHRTRGRPDASSALFGPGRLLVRIVMEEVEKIKEELNTLPRVIFDPKMKIKAEKASEASSNGSQIEL